MISFEQAYAYTCAAVPDVRSFSENEARRYWDLLTSLRPESIVVEIGLQYGRSSTLVAQAANEIGFLHIGIDPFIDPHGAEVSWVEQMSRIGHRFCLIHLRSDDKAMHDLLPVAGIDLALIDGDHWADAVRNDIDLLSKLVMRSGDLLFHDYGVGLPNVYPPVDPEFVRNEMPSGWEELETVDTLGVWRRL